MMSYEYMTERFCTLLVIVKQSNVRNTSACISTLIARGLINLSIMLLTDAACLALSKYLCCAMTTLVVVIEDTPCKVPVCLMTT